MAEGDSSSKLPMWSAAAVVVIVIGVFLLLNASSAPVERNLAGSAIHDVSVPSDVALMQNIGLGSADFRVTHVESFTEMGYVGATHSTNELFIKPHLEVINYRAQAVRVPELTFTLIDEQGRTYQQVPDNQLYVDGVVRLAGWLRPGESRAGVLVFEVPTSAQALALEISSEDGVVFIELDEITNIGVDTSLEDRMLEELLLELEDEFYDEEW